MRILIIGLIAASLGAGACGQNSTNVTNPAGTTAGTAATDSNAGPTSKPMAGAAKSEPNSLLNHPERLPSDRDSDARRKPDQVLAFFGIKRGMTVLDMFSGTGYYSELLSYIVGPEGSVHAHNNTPYLDWREKELAKRYTKGRLTNVKRFAAENNELSLSADTFDAVLLILTYHDVYHVQPESGWDEIDGPVMLAEIFQSMKSGAVLGVVDHAAASGAPPETGETLHRIDPELAKQEITAAGFVFEAESQILHNPDDPRTEIVFSKAIKGKTDRFIFRFRKP